MKPETNPAPLMQIKACSFILQYGSVVLGDISYVVELK